MSVSIEEVLQHGGYDFSKEADCKWLVSQVAAFEELVTDAEDFIEKCEDERDEKQRLEEEAEDEKAEAEYAAKELANE